MKTITDTEKIIIRSEKQLLENFFSRANQKGSASTMYLICGGHFMLMPDIITKELVAGVFDDTNMSNNSASRATGIFPQYTWKIACKLLKGLREINQIGLLSLLINDWQLVPPDSDRHPDKPNRFRESFYHSFTELPQVYQQELDRHNLNFPADLYRISSKEFYLREVRLRDRFVRRVKNLVTQLNVPEPVGMCSLRLDPNGNVMMCTEDDAEYALTLNSKAGCAGGICQMMVDITQDLGKQYSHIHFINLMPNGCMEPVNVATELALNWADGLRDKQLINVTNLYFEGYHSRVENDFYAEDGRGVSCFHF